jgi:hypothetical protein
MTSRTRDTPHWWHDVNGYKFIRHEGQTVAHHRLIAYAYGMIDSLDDPREVDHIDTQPGIDYEAGLQALSERDHATITRARERRRKRRERTLAAFTDGGENGGGQV